MAEKRLKCNECGEELRFGEFYKSSSPMYKHNCGKLTICKRCVFNRYQLLLTRYNGSAIDSFRHLCVNLDVFFDEQLYLYCTDKAENFIGEYFTKVNGRKEYREKTSMNNSLNGTGDRDVAVQGGVVTDEMILRWGRGRKADDYRILEKRYKQALEDYPSDTPAQKDIIRSICLLDLDIEEARVINKSDVPKLEKAKADKFKQLGINPSDNKMYDKDSAVIFGNIMKIYETEKPVVDVQEQYKDVDRMNDYWDRNLVKPMLRAEDLAKGDYSLEHGADNIEVDPVVKNLMDDNENGK